jgi:hypothetical protein
VKFRPFAEAREYMHSLKLQNQDEWRAYSKSMSKPADIPKTPEKVYREEWKGMGDWLGTGRVASQDIEFLPFEKAKEFVHSLGLKSQTEWGKYCKSGKRPKNVPSNPHATYRKYWKGYGDWLGTGTISPQAREYRPFNEAREYVHSLGLKGTTDWKQYCNSGMKPQDIPSQPRHVYRKYWKGMGDWLGTGTIATLQREYRPFEEAREYIRKLGLNTQEEWRNYRKSGKKPADIPANPNRTYKQKWKGWGDWLGTGRIANLNREYLPFEEARGYVRKLGLKDTDEWVKYIKSGKKHPRIPAAAPEIYKKDWKGFPDWLGYEGEYWSARKLKELLRDLIKSRIIYEWNEAVLYSLLLRRGLLNLHGRHEQFLKNLIDTSRTYEGRKAIEQYVNSDSEVPPDLSKLTSEGDSQEQEEQVESASSEELANLVEDTDPLDYGKIKTAEQILNHTNLLESINIDEEAMQFYLDYSIDELWKSAFREKEKVVLAVKQKGKNGNRYHDMVVETFLSDYEGTKGIKIPKGYAFPYPPTLMQLYVAYKVKTNQYLGNFSGTGAGKTLSAILASRVIDSKMTLIVCPNDVVSQWEKSILEIFPDSVVTTGKQAFYAKNDENKYQYLVLNYDKFSQEESPNLILNLAKGKVDFVVLDEIHFVKKRDEESSQRRKNLDGLMTAVRKKNNNAKVLGLSATPVVNNLMEGRSLLELITGKVYDDVATSPTIPNAVTLYEKLSLVSIRELPKYDIDVHTEHIDVKTQIQQNGIVSIKELK